MKNKIDGMSANIIEIDEFKKLNNKQGENKMTAKNTKNQDGIFTGSLYGNGFITFGVIPDKFAVSEIIINYPVTIINWEDGEKTIVKQSDGDVRDDEKAIVWAIAKRAMGTNAVIDRLIKNASRPQEKKNKKEKIGVNSELSFKEVNDIMKSVLKKEN